MVGSITFDDWSGDCPLRDGYDCVKAKKHCDRNRCPRIMDFLAWRKNEKERYKPKKDWT